MPRTIKVPNNMSVENVVRSVYRNGQQQRTLDANTRPRSNAVSGLSSKWVDRPESRKAQAIVALKNMFELYDARMNAYHTKHAELEILEATQNKYRRILDGIAKAQIALHKGVLGRLSAELPATLRLDETSRLLKEQREVMLRMSFQVHETKKDEKRFAHAHTLDHEELFERRATPRRLRNAIAVLVRNGGDTGDTGDTYMFSRYDGRWHLHYFEQKDETGQTASDRIQMFVTKSATDDDAEADAAAEEAADSAKEALITQTGTSLVQHARDYIRFQTRYKNAHKEYFVTSTGFP